MRTVPSRQACPIPRHRARGVLTSKQAFFSVRHFRDGVLGWTGAGENMRVMAALKEVCPTFPHPAPAVHPPQLFQNMGDTSLSVVSRQRMEGFMNLARPVRSTRGTSQCAADFTRHLLSLMGGGSPAAVFEGTSQKTTTCDGCNGTSAVEQGFTSLSLPFPPAPHPPEGLRLQELLASYLAPERLEGDAQYECGHCKSKQNATQSLALTGAPRALLVTLNHYEYDRNQQGADKHMMPIDTPATLQLPIEIDGAAGAGMQYTLVAVVFHTGASLHAGHFICCAADEDSTASWHLLDDTKTARCTLQEVGSHG